MCSSKFKQLSSNMPKCFTEGDEATLFLLKDLAIFSYQLFEKNIVLTRECVNNKAMCC